MSVAITVGLVLVIAVAAMLWQRFGARAGRIDRVLLVAREGGVLVVEDSSGHGRGIRSYRQTAWRLRDGVKLGRHAADLRMLGATDEILWCSSREMPVHARDPVTFAVVHDQRAVAGALELKALTDRDNPVFDQTAGGVHAYTRDGRSYLFTPDLKAVETARSEIEQPITASAYDRGKLSVTHRLGDKTLRLRLKRSPDDDTPEVITAIDPDHAERWSSTFPPATLTRAIAICATVDRIVFVIGPSATRQVGDGMDADFVGGNEGYAFIALDAASGVEVWRRRV